VIVITHQIRTGQRLGNATVSFATGGIERALAKAKEISGTT
jgi:hypothetical protein